MTLNVVRMERAISELESDVSDIEDDIAGIVQVPTGAIVMWHGLLSAIPTGWTLCDGTSSTPDLRDKFVRGAAAAANPGTTGGSDTHTLIIDEMPAHTHSYQNMVGSGSYEPGGEISDDPVNQTTGSTGGGGAHNNIPAYYAIAYIMKT